MRFCLAALVAALSAASVTSFAQKLATAFVVPNHHALCARSATVAHTSHSSSCDCAACARSASKRARCSCAGCIGGRSTMLFALGEDLVEAASSSEEPVAAPDVSTDSTETTASDDATAARSPRKSFKTKPKGLPLSDFKVGDSVKGKVKSVTAYGAFVDIGAETDGLLHISNLSVDFVSSVKDVLEAGKEYDVRILTVDAGKKQIALTLLTAEQEEEATANAASSRPSPAKRPQQSNNNAGSSNKRDDSAILNKLKEKGWDDSIFVTGTVVSTVDFGAFVRVNGNALNPELESGEFDGLVHISALAVGRTTSVSSVCKVGDEVKVRVKSIDDRKVSLTMVSVEDEAAQAELRGSSGGGGGEQGFQGNKDWKEAMESLQKEKMPSFANRPMVVDNRK